MNALVSRYEYLKSPFQGSGIFLIFWPLDTGPKTQILHKKSCVGPAPKLQNPKYNPKNYQKMVVGPERTSRFLSKKCCCFSQDILGRGPITKVWQADQIISSKDHNKAPLMVPSSDQKAGRLQGLGLYMSLDKASYLI